ncbi:MAG: single-stranded DNA-binding protein [Lachnospiraceae bacterium]|nr:single-stranded DNA-binding protein [Lachnospiraceae bacterium]
MSLNYNKVILSGRLTARPELKSTQSGKSFCSFSLAVDRQPKQDGTHETDFLNITAWDKTAEFITRYFDKGYPLFVEGSLRVRSWTDQSGQKRYATEILAERVNFVESKKTADANAGYTPPAYAPAYAPAPAPAPGNAQTTMQVPPVPAAPQWEEIGDDEELPF